MGDLSSGKWDVDFHENQPFPWASVSTGDTVVLSCDRSWILQYFGNGWDTLASLLSCPDWLPWSALFPGCGWGHAWTASVCDSGVKGTHRGSLNCPDNVPSLGLSDCLHLQVPWTYGLCYCASLGWFSPEPMFSHHHFSVIWETLFAMETNICWARDADSGPVGLCSYSWICVRAVRDSWLIYLVLFPVLCCGAQSCAQLLPCQGGWKSEGKQGMACHPVGFVCCPTASPTPSVCAWWPLAVHRDNVRIK